MTSVVRMMRVFANCGVSGPVGRRRGVSPPAAQPALVCRKICPCEAAIFKLCLETLTELTRFHCRQLASSQFVTSRCLLLNLTESVEQYILLKILMLSYEFAYMQVYS